MTPRNLLTLTTSSAALLLLLLAAPGCPTDPPADDDDATSDDDDSAGDDDDATLPDDELDCSGADEATCGATASGTSVGADNNVYGYAICDLNATGFTGGEAVFEFTAANAGEHTFELTWSDATNDIDLFVLDLCSTSADDGATCLGYSIEETTEESVTVTLEADATVYLVIDGWDGGESAFDLTASCPAPGDDDDSAGDDDDSAGDDDDSAGDDDDSAGDDDDSAGDDDDSAGDDDDSAGDDDDSAGDDDDSAGDDDDSASN